MQINDELKKKLQKEFFEELLPKWDIENDFLQLGKKYLMDGEYIIAKNIFDDVLFVDPDNEIAKVYKQFAALVLAGEKSQEQLEILNKLLQDVDYLLQKQEYKEILKLVDILNDMIKKPERFYKLQSKIIEAKLNLTFDEFCTAYDRKEWDKVIKLGRQMVALDYSEEAHPIKDKVRKAKLNLLNNKLCETYKNEKWVDVIQFSGEMSALGYDENEFPIIDKVSFSLYMIGLGWLHNNEFEKAIQPFLDAIALKPKFPEALRELGMTYYNVNLLDDAETYLTKVLRHLPKDAHIRFFLGKIYYDKHEYRQAEHFLKTAKQLEPKNAATLQFLAKAYFQQRKFEKAKAEYIEVLGLAPKSKGVLMDLGHLCLYMEDYHSAERYLIEAKDMDPKNYIILNNLSVAKFGLGKIKDAENFIEEAKETGVISAEIYCNLATFFWQENDITNAQKYIEEAYRLNKNHPTINKNREIIVRNLQRELTLIAIS